MDYGKTLFNTAGIATIFGLSVAGFWLPLAAFVVAIIAIGVVRYGWRKKKGLGE